MSWHRRLQSRSVSGSRCRSRIANSPLGSSGCIDNGAYLYFIFERLKEALRLPLRSPEKCILAPKYLHCKDLTTSRRRDPRPCLGIKEGMAYLWRNWQANNVQI